LVGKLGDSGRIILGNQFTSLGPIEDMLGPRSVVVKGVHEKAGESIILPMEVIVSVEGERLREIGRICGKLQSVWMANPSFDLVNLLEAFMSEKKQVGISVKYEGGAAKDVSSEVMWPNMEALNDGELERCLDALA
jgi:hypothetical protein